MKRTRVAVWLTVCIATLAICPLVAALYFVNESLTTSLNLGFNPQIVAALDSSSQHLKVLAQLDHANEARYRAEFEQLQSLRSIYGSPELIKDALRHSLTVYFLVGMVAALLLSLVVATYLSRKIAASYRATFDDLVKSRERMRYLEEISSWQELAKMLAHEIKNPLTPIEVLITSLSKAYLAKPQGEFLSQLKHTETMISEELAHLKNTVNKFSEFARLPSVSLQEEDLESVLRQHIQAIGPLFERAALSFKLPESGLKARVDRTLLRQVLSNIVRNGVEANPDRIVSFCLTLASNEHTISITISNDGKPVSPDIVPRMFDPYVSSQSNKENMGLGLAIARKIVLEHGGDISYAEMSNQPTFTIVLPRAKS